jgi:hypothetical protein
LLGGGRGRKKEILKELLILNPNLVKTNAQEEKVYHNGKRYSIFWYMALSSKNHKASGDH